MVVIDTIFKIANIFGLLSEEEYARNYNKAREQWKVIEVAEVPQKEYKGFDAILRKIKQFEENWLFCIAVAIGQIFLIRAVTEYLQPRDEEQEKKDLLNRFKI